MDVQLAAEQLARDRLPFLWLVQPHEISRLPVSEVGFELEAISRLSEPQPLEFARDGLGLTLGVVPSPSIVRMVAIEISHVQCRCTADQTDRLAFRVEHNLDHAEIAQATHVGDREVKRDAPLERVANPLGLAMEIPGERHTVRLLYLSNC